MKQRLNHSRAIALGDGKKVPKLIGLGPNSTKFRKRAVKKARQKYMEDNGLANLTLEQIREIRRQKMIAAGYARAPNS
jgi:ribosomal protein L11